MIFKLAKFWHETWPLANLVPEVAHIHPFHPRGWKWDYFCSTGSGFHCMSLFVVWKMPYLGMKLSHWPKFQKLHIYYLSNPGGRKLSLFSLYEQRFLRYGSILTAIFGYETCRLAKFAEVEDIYSFSVPGGRNWAYFLFLLHGKRFLRYMPIFKSAIFGHKTLPLAKVTEGCTFGLFLPQRV